MSGEIYGASLFSQIEYERDGFEWDSKRQNEVLGAFFLLHWTTQLPGGMLASRYGTKLVFGLANFIGCVTCIFVPITAYLNYNAMILLRLVQGIVAGAAWPGELSRKHTLTRVSTLDEN